MTSYKKMHQETEEKLQMSLHQIEILQDQLILARKGLCDEVCQRIDDDEARDVLRLFADRAKNREELVLLIRALSKL